MQDADEECRQAMREDEKAQNCNRNPLSSVVTHPSVTDLIIAPSFVCFPSGFEFSSAFFGERAAFQVRTCVIGNENHIAHTTHPQGHKTETVVHWKLEL
jgi:hypothetical protein